MITFCGDPYGLVPCTGCPRCARPPPPPTFHEADTEIEPEESEPTECSADSEDPDEHEEGHDYDHVEETDLEEATETAQEGLMDDEETTEGESSDDSDSSSDTDGATSDSSEDTVESPVTSVIERVVRRRGILRSRAAPYPAPSHRVYREAGGLRWMYTPRKRVPATRQEDVFRFSLPAPTASDSTAPAPTASVSTIPVPTASAATVPVPDLPVPSPPRPDLAVQVQSLTTRQRDADFQIQLLIDELGEAHREIGRLRASELAQNHRITRLELLVSEIQQSRQPPPQL
jgi:hypothetical protein